MGWPGPMTLRQYRAWVAWLGDEWNHPSRTDYYLMQMAGEMRRGLATVQVKRQKKIKPKDLEIEFTLQEVDSSGKAKRGKLTAAEATKVSKALWGARLQGVRQQAQRRGPSPAPSPAPPPRRRQDAGPLAEPPAGAITEEVPPPAPPRRRRG